MTFEKGNGKNCGTDMQSTFHPISVVVFTVHPLPPKCVHVLLIQRKIIPLEEGKSITLGRAGRHNPALKTNGLFEYPTFNGEPVLSRNHAQLIYHQNEVHLKCFNKNTFVSGERVGVNESTKIQSSFYLILGGYLKDSFSLVEGSVNCFVRIFDAGSEDFKYFLRVEEEFPFCCQWPGTPPGFTIRLEMLYSSITDRIEVLKVLAGVSETELDKWATVNDSVQDAHKLNTYLEMVSEDFVDYKKLYMTRQNDYVSQYSLAVACCRNFRSRNWFITQERKLFILRWLRMLPHQQMAFLKLVKADYNEVADDELKILTSLHSAFFPPSVKYFKVPFTDVPTFLKRRRVTLFSGYCYISLQDMFAPLIKKLRSSLWHTTKVARSNLDKIWYDDRIRPIINFVEDQVCDPDRYKPNKFGEKVSERNIHTLCDESFPLCMKILHYHLCRDHHLRNGGRFQYTLFLKGIGLSMAGSLCFWKAHFTKKIEETVFMKRYSYHIRHAYGVEGKMADYPPQNCAEIIKAAPGPLEYHGCPFAVLDEIRMKEALYRSGLKKEVYSEVLDLAKKGTPQDACKRYFELTQGGKYSHLTVCHPNIYYDESRRLIREKKDRVLITFEPPKNIGTKPKPPAPKISLDW